MQDNKWCTNTQDGGGAMLHYQFGIPFHIYVNPLRLNIFLPFSFSRKITLDQTLAPMCICNDTRSKSTQKKKEKKKEWSKESTTQHMLV